MTWQPIETAPRDGRPFMVYITESDTGPHCLAPVSKDSGDDWWDESTGDCIKPIKGATHWMPLPAPPVVEDDAIASEEDEPIKNAIAWAWSAPEDMEDVGGPEHQEAYRGLLAALDSSKP